MLKAALLLPVTAAIVWAAGFAWFLRVAMQAPGDAPQADGIVAFTGGAERVETALHLLAEGRARLLLVSGVNRAAEFPELARRAGVDPALAPRVTLGRAAADTHGNALETAAWAHEHDIQTLIVVTAGYHMPRAVAELSRTLPDVTLFPFPVLSPALRSGPAAASMRLLAGEYTKWLAFEAGLSGLNARNEEHEMAQPHAPERRG